MRIVSHTCSNTEIVCALGAAEQLVGVDADSDFPAETVAGLPKLGRDLDLDMAAVAALKPDLVLSSLTVPGHEAVLDGLRAQGLNTWVADPESLEDVYTDILAIGELLGATDRARVLVHEMRASMPPRDIDLPPSVLIEWWPKPVITPGRRSWASDVLRLAGGRNPWGSQDCRSVSLAANEVPDVDAVVMSWCGVPAAKYRADIVSRRDGWSAVPAVSGQRIYAVTEAWLGRPGPRLAQGYKALCEIVDHCVLATREARPWAV